MTLFAWLAGIGDLLYQQNRYNFTPSSDSDGGGFYSSDEHQEALEVEAEEQAVQQRWEAGE